MPLHDYRCRTCGALQRDVYRDILEGASARPPVHCDQPMVWIPQVGVMDAKEPFQRFVTQVRQPDGSYRPVTIDSLRKLRQVERDTETAARNGEGEQLVWRDYANDRSNGDRHTLGADPAPVLSARTRATLTRQVLDAQTAEATAYGPGVTDATTSAVKGPSDE